MDRIKRVVVAALAALASLLLVAPPAAAAFPATMQITGYRLGQDGNIVYPTAQVACDAFAPAGGNGSTGVLYNFDTVPNAHNGYSSCKAMRDGEQKANIGVYYIPGPVGCPANSTLSGGQCTCTAPQVQNGTNDGCTAPPPCPALGASFSGSTSSSQYSGSAGYGGGLLCNGGCKAYPSASWKAPDGKWYATGPLTSVGSNATCSTTPAPGGSDTPTAEPPPVACSTGKCPGTVNGISVCVPCSSGSTGSTPYQDQTGEAPTGGDSPTDTPTGTTTSGGTTNTTCTDTSCTTTSSTTTTGTGGNAQTVTATKTESKDDFCTRNPRSPLCVTSSFSGSCDGGFVGEGDALQKATAEAVNKTRCLLDPGNGLDGIKTQLQNGTFAADLPVVAKTVSQFDQTNPYGNSCPADVVVQMQSIGTFTIPLSQMCVYLQLLGYIALGVTLISSTIFVIKGFK
jgi:hypothetical protein